MAHYDLLQVSPRRYYVHNVETKARFSHKPLGRKVALRQLHAIRAASPEEVGEGLMSWAANKVKAVAGRVRDVVQGPREDFSPKVRDFLKKVGGNTIERLLVCRTPVAGFLTGAMNAISFGRFGAAMKKEGIEGVFHLSLICEYKEGKHLKHCVLEKNEVLNASNTIQNKEHAEFLPVDMDHHPTIDQLIANTMAKVSKQRFFLYAPFNRGGPSGPGNCQLFIGDLLASNGFMTDDLSSFIHQDAKALGDHMGQPYKAVFGALTTAGALADVAIQGRGFALNQQRKRMVQGAGLEHLVHHVLTQLAKKPRARKVRKA